MNTSFINFTYLGGCDLFEDVDDGKEVLAGSAEGDVFSLHCREGDETVEMAPPLNWTVSKGDDVSGAAAGAVRVVWMLVAPESGEVRVGVAVKAEGVVRVKDEAFLRSSQEVLGNAFEGYLMRLPGVK